MKVLSLLHDIKMTALDYLSKPLFYNTFTKNRLIIMVSITIREAKKTDISSVISLYEQVEMDNGDTISKVKAIALFEKMQRYPYYKVFVACNKSNAEIIGVFCLLIMDNLGHKGSPSAVIEGVCVKETMHGLGIGKQMMLEAKKLAQKEGCYKLALTSNNKRTKAHQFYQSLGFNQHGISFQLTL